MMAKYYKSSTRRKIILNMRSVCSVSSSKPHSFSSGTWEAEVGPSLEFEANMVYREVSGLGQPELCSETLSQINKANKNQGRFHYVRT